MLRSNYTGGIQLFPAVFSQWVTPRYHHIWWLCCTALFEPLHGGRALPSSGLLEGLTLFAEDTGLIVGRTLVDPSKWKVPVLVSNFSQETIVVNPFTELGMITQVTAIQSVANTPPTATEYDQNTTTSPTRFGGTDMPGSGSYTETPPCNCIVRIFGYISSTGSPSHRSHGCSGTQHQYGRPATHPLCTTTHVTPEDEKRRGMRC